MAFIYHPGEIEVQTRAGVRGMAMRVGNIIRDSIPAKAQAFLRSQRTLVVATVDSEEWVWASLLTGEPSFVHARDERTVEVDAAPAPGDPLGENLRMGGGVGLLAIDLQDRRRMRANGRVTVLLPKGGFKMQTEQVYSNCQKYIQARKLLPAEEVSKEAGSVSRFEGLTDRHREWIERCDTFFIASAHPQDGADASHRGGYPGFVRVSGNQLLFPDYCGNSMFNTLGNIAANPCAGLLFVDWDQGSTLQLTGRARIIWDQERAAEFPGAERLVELEVEEVVEIDGGCPFLGHLLEYSPSNPE